VTIIPVRPEIPIQIITTADVRASIGRAKRSLEKAADEVIWQIEMEAWKTLGYPSWAAMLKAEYGGAACMLPTGSRPQVAVRLKEITVGTTARGGPKRLTNQGIADTIGVSERQVKRDLADNKEGQMSPPVASAPDDDVIDAEIVEDDEPTPDATTDPVPAESATAVTCPTCHGTGKVTK